MARSSSLAFAFFSWVALKHSGTKLNESLSKLFILLFSGMERAARMNLSLMTFLSWTVAVFWDLIRYEMLYRA